MADKYANRVDRAGDPARNMFLITPHDTNPLPILPKAIRANTAGTVAFKPIDGDGTLITITMAAGEQLAVRANIVTTATNAVVHGLA